MEWRGYLTVKKTLMIRLAVSTEYRCVTDGRMDGQTDRHLATAYVYASRDLRKFVMIKTLNYVCEAKVK